MRGLHGLLVMRRRIRALSACPAELLPENSTVLDIGAGSGEIACEIIRLRPDLTISGIDLKVRDNTRIRIEPFDGRVINHAAAAFDYCLRVDVLHHTDDPGALLGEACRVAGQGVIIKDHLCENRLDRSLLAFMDWVGNGPFGSNLEYNYLSRSDWNRLLSSVGLRAEKFMDDIKLYPFPFGLLFEAECMS